VISREHAEALAEVIRAIEAEAIDISRTLQARLCYRLHLAESAAIVGRWKAKKRPPWDRDHDQDSIGGWSRVVKLYERGEEKL
jgi:hypothetical protein